MAMSSEKAQYIERAESKVRLESPSPQIRRRPVPSPTPSLSRPSTSHATSSYFTAPAPSDYDSYPSVPPPSYESLHVPLRPRPVRSATNLRAVHDEPRTGIVDRRGELPVDFVVDELPSPGYLTPGSLREVRRVKSSSAISAAAEDQRPKDPPKWKAALGEAQYFAGGLISHPAETTRHYSVIRHSHALIWYRGPATTVSITILSDTPLPSTRSLWLQQKGYSGNMGMSLKGLLGTTGSWLDVTPATKAGVEHIPEGDERGMQRDLRRFAKRATGRAKGHVARETHVVRIPASSTDGYFRLVICAGEDGKKILCGSPVFRVASTSTDISVVKGASIRTMPLEVGVKVATTVGQQVAKRYAGLAGAVVQSRAAKVVSNAAVQKVMPRVKKASAVGQMAYQKSGMNDVVGESWQRNKAGRYDALVMESALTVVGDDTGPEAPFPVIFDGKVVRGTGRSTEELGIPTANLREVRDDIKMRMRGVYAAWASILPSKAAPQDISHDWHEAIITIAPLRHAPPEVILKNRVTVHFTHDFDDTTFFDTRVKVILMGHLHPAPHRDEDPDELVRIHAEDTMTALASLGRERWSVEEALGRVGEKSLGERLDGGMVDVRGRVDRLPLHWAGVRSEGVVMRDAVYGNGGLWVSRDEGE